MLYLAIISHIFDTITFGCFVQLFRFILLIYITFHKFNWLNLVIINCHILYCTIFFIINVHYTQI
jgi:hypothetical protein